MARRSKRSAGKIPRLRSWFLGLNLSLAAILCGWYAFQPQERQTEVRRLLTNAFENDKQVSVVDVAWDVWQLYYADSAAGKIAPGDKTIIYGGAPEYAGIPAMPLRLLTNRGYVVGYNDGGAYPAWVAYHVKDVGKLPVPPPRPDKFEMDPRTVSRISPEDYAGSGYDRGHLAPNYVIATRFGEEAQRETFLMSNIMPQRHALNAGLWKELELKVATSYPARYAEVWVFAGPIFGDHLVKLHNRVPVPEAFFMILVDEQDGKLRTLAFVIPQDVEPKSDPNAFLTTVAEIQQRTHLDFFRELDDVSEAEIEKFAAKRAW